MFNSEANLNNFLTNNEYMREILSSIENEKGRDKINSADKEKDKDNDSRKEKEVEKSSDKFITSDPILNSLYRELTSIRNVLIKKITDYQALARDCRGSSKGGVGELIICPKRIMYLRILCVRVLSFMIFCPNPVCIFLPK